LILLNAKRTGQRYLSQMIDGNSNSGDDDAERLREQAELCLRMANRTTDERVAHELRKLANDCLRAASETPTIH
jgi:hypothetical protein